MLASEHFFSTCVCFGRSMILIHLHLRRNLWQQYHYHHVICHLLPLTCNLGPMKQNQNQQINADKCLNCVISVT